MMAIGALSGSVQGTETTVTSYSATEGPKTNEDVKERLEVLAVRKKNADKKTD